MYFINCENKHIIKRIIKIYLPHLRRGGNGLYLVEAPSREDLKSFN